MKILGNRMGRANHFKMKKATNKQIPMPFAVTQVVTV
jgi:hypothetical protein